MPDYDFRCKACGHTFTLSTASVEEIEQVEPQCPQCDSVELSRLIRRVGIVTSEERRMERLMDPSRLAGLDEDDPRAMGQLMREMTNELGEDAGPEMDEVIDRLESGESPEAIESSMDLGADEGAGGLM